MNETKTQNKISVIIPVYNTAPYLERCLGSVLQSTYRNLEIICVNDGSTDESLTILEHYQELDDRVVVIDQNNSGVSAARNKGMARVTGDFISFVDSDDWVHPQMFEVLRNAMDEDVIMAACARKRVHHEEPTVQLDAVPTVRIYSSLGEAYCGGFTDKFDFIYAHLYRTEILNGKYFDEELTIGEDTMFNLMLEKTPGKCAVVEESLYFYFQRDNSAVHSVSTEKCLEYAKKRSEFAKKENLICKGLIDENVIKWAFAYRYELMFTKEHNQAAKTARECIREAVKNLRRDQMISIKKIVVYTIMNYFPVLYRIYRIALDPTMLDWEKKQKKLRFELKNRKIDL